jgi:hypothetical protein
MPLSHLDTISVLANWILWRDPKWGMLGTDGGVFFGLNFGLRFGLFLGVLFGLLYGLGMWDSSTEKPIVRFRREVRPS